MSVVDTCIVVWSFVLAAVGTGAMRRLAVRRNLLDVPNMRSSHSSPTPRGGGAAIVVGFFTALGALACFNQLPGGILLALLAGGASIALTGFLDDLRPLPAHFRLAVHSAMAILTVILVGGIPELSLWSWGLHWVWLGGALGAVTLIWATNLFNFMDGIDGIAGSEAVFVAAAGAWFNWRFGGDGALSVALLSLGSASLGFLVWNWPPASIFMGDVGSGFLGFTLATLGLAASQRSMVPIEVWGILSGVFLVDTSVTLLRRIIRGDRWFAAHRTHAYQRLARRCASHMPVTIGVIVIDFAWLFPWAWLAATNPARALLCLAAALIPLLVLALALGAGGEDR